MRNLENIYSNILSTSASVKKAVKPCLIGSNMLQLTIKLLTA